MTADLTAETDAGLVTGYLAVPRLRPLAAGVAMPGNELFRLNDDIRAITDRFAVRATSPSPPDLMPWNWVACLAARPARWAPAEERLRSGSWRFGTGFAERDDCTRRVGIAGFCLGGGFAIVLANQGTGCRRRPVRQTAATSPPHCRAAVPWSRPTAPTRWPLPGAAPRIEAARRRRVRPTQRRRQGKAPLVHEIRRTRRGGPKAVRRLMHVGYVAGSHRRVDRIPTLFDLP
ncbi:MAG: hypothetical protein U0R64_07855 [Candidatus Nanopelagicales bacterium]